MYPGLARQMFAADNHMICFMHVIVVVVFNDVTHADTIVSMSISSITFYFF